MANNPTENLEEYRESLNKINDTPILIYINQWEAHSIAKIRLAAEQARTSIMQIISEKTNHFLDRLKRINEKIQFNQQNHTILYEYEKQLHKIQQDLSNPLSLIYLEHDRNSLPIHLIKLRNENGDGIKSANDERKNQQTIIVPGTEPITMTEFRRLNLDDQKQTLGERLFVLIQQYEPRFAAKITGMFLELDNEYILMLIRSQNMLRHKIKEAIIVLRTHQNQPFHIKNTESLGGHNGQ